MGKCLQVTTKDRVKFALITEVEAYRAGDDLASHAYRGMTPRNAVMFGTAGFSYIYFIYGMYHCLNIVTEPQGQAGAVLIRAIKFLNGKEINGPGRVCKALNINRNYSGLDCLDKKGIIKLCSGVNVSKSQIKQTKRIGISKGLAKPWRWVLSGVKFFR